MAVPIIKNIVVIFFKELYWECICLVPGISLIYKGKFCYVVYLPAVLYKGLRCLREDDMWFIYSTGVSQVFFFYGLLENFMIILRQAVMWVKLSHSGIWTSSLLQLFVWWVQLIILSIIVHKVLELLFFYQS